MQNVREKIETDKAMLNYLKLTTQEIRYGWKRLHIKGNG